MRARISGGSLTRRGSKLVLAIAVLSVMSFVMTGAQAQILGSVTGTVTITSPAAGITSTCAPTTYSFSGVEIVGTLTAGAAAFTGNVSVSGVTGSSSGPHPFSQCANGLENSEGASGNVNSAGTPATFGGSSTPPGHTITGRFWGEPTDMTCGSPINACGYVRRGTLVTVRLHVEYCLDSTFVSCFPGGIASASATKTIVTVIAQFTPSGINTSTAGVTSAIFQGSFNN